MRILIVVPRSLNKDDINYNYLFPLGLGYISSVLKQAGFQVDCLNLNHRSGNVEKLIHDVLNTAGKFDFVCTGGLSPHYHRVKEIVCAVHSHESNTKIILGGGLISSEPELMLNALNPDFIVIGEGEKAIVELLSCVDINGKPGEVLGIGYRGKSGQIICNKPQPAIMDLDSLPWPDFEIFEFDRYLDNLKPSDQYFYDLFDSPRVYPLVCSRSCPYSCTFCFHPLGNKYRQRSLDSVMSELEFAIKRYRINLIAIYDELFSCDRERVYEFCRRIKKLFEEVPWECRWGCQMRVEGLDEEFLKTMKDAGCYMVSYGFESYSPVVLNSMKKHITTEQIDNAIPVTLKNNVSIQGNFIFGDKAETTQTANETLDYWKRNNYAGIILGFINPYPGTELYNNCIKKMIIRDRLDFIENHISANINMTDVMTDEEFDKLRLDIFEAELRYSMYALPLSLSKTDVRTYQIRVKCPHCSEIVEYKNYQISYRLFYNKMLYCRQCRRRFFLVSVLYHYMIKIYLLIYPFTTKRIKTIAYNAKDNLVHLKLWLMEKYGRLVL